MASIRHSKTLKNSEHGQPLLTHQNSYVNWKRQMDSPTGAGLRPSSSRQQLLAGGGLEPLNFDSSKPSSFDTSRHHDSKLPADKHDDKVLTRLSAVESGQEAIVSELREVAKSLADLDKFVRLAMGNQTRAVDLTDVRCGNAFGCVSGSDAEDT